MAWQKLASDTLTGAATSQDNSITTAKKLCQILAHRIGTTLNTLKYRLGKTTIDAGTNYCRRSSTNGAADTTAVTQDNIMNVRSSNTEHFTIFDIINIGTQEKLIIAHNVALGAAGAATAPERIEFVAKWVNTTDQFDQVRQFGDTANELATDTNLTTLGTD